LKPPFCGIPGVPAWRSDPDTRFEQNELMAVEPNPCTPDLRAGVMVGNLNVVTPAGGRSLHKVPLDQAALE